MPTLSELNYTKEKHNITRVSFDELQFWLADFPKAEIVLERPMVNPKRFTATQSALRALEATLCVLESLNCSKIYIDSKEWQKVMLPKGTKGTPDLKKASLDIGCRMFPEHKEMIDKQGDADGMLIAEWARRTR